MPSGHPLKITENILCKLYIEEDLSIREIAHKLGTFFRPIQRRLQLYNIKKDKNLINKSLKRNIKKTMIVKYGTDHYMKSKKGYKQYIFKLKQNYNITNIMQLQSTKEQRAKTCLIKYGVDHDLKSPTVRNKMKKTLLKKYGVDNAFKSKKLMAFSLSRRKIINGYFGKGKHIHTRFGIIFIRSSYEEKLLCLLNESKHVHSIIYEPFIIPINNSEYIPDFLINNYYIIEVKPKRFIFPKHTDNDFVKKIAANNLLKHNAIKKWILNKEYKYLLVTESEITKEWCDQQLTQKP